MRLWQPCFLLIVITLETSQERTHAATHHLEVGDAQEGEEAEIRFCRFENAQHFILKSEWKTFCVYTRGVGCMFVSCCHSNGAAGVAPITHNRKHLGHEVYWERDPLPFEKQTDKRRGAAAALRTTFKLISILQLFFMSIYDPHKVKNPPRPMKRVLKNWFTFIKWMEGHHYCRYDRYHDN